MTEDILECAEARVGKKQPLSRPDFPRQHFQALAGTHHARYDELRLCISNETSNINMSDSSSESEDLSTTGLIATRAKRATAGNLYATLRQNLDDEELQRELLAEDEEDQEDFEGSEKDEDDAMSSSGDEDEGDAGPPQAGSKEDLEGEKELKWQERAQARKKRKMEEAKMRLPAWHKKKTVKLADDVKTEDGSSSKPKKKSERANWLPNEQDMPVRQSSRASAVANRKLVHGHLKDSIERSEKQKKIMAQHQGRVKANTRMEITQEARLTKAAKIEKETAREFGRWEREEAERQRIREEQLAAKRKRGIDGPVIRHWSGSVLWVGDHISNDRLHGSQRMEENTTEKYTTQEHMTKEVFGPGIRNEDSTTSISTPAGVPATPGFAGSQPLQPAESTRQPPVFPPQPPAQEPVSWLEGIHACANQLEPSASSQLPTENPSPHLDTYTPSAPAINVPRNQSYPLPQSAVKPDSSSSHPPVYHGWPPGYNQFQLNTPQQQPPPTPPPPPPIPLIKQQAQRSLIMLEQFAKLDAPEKSRRGSTKALKYAPLDPTPIASILLPLSYPTFTPEQTRYLTAKLKRSVKEPFPSAPKKQRCALTPWEAKYRDPMTGLAYTGLMEYKMIQRLLAGGCQWSAVLGCWVGPTYGDMGRPARGVPEGFGVPVRPKEGAVTTGSSG